MLPTTVLISASGVLLALSAACVVLARRSRRLAANPDACARCHYDLRGNSTRMCPECGCADDPRTRRRIARRRIARRLLAGIALFAAAAGCGVLAYQAKRRGNTWTDAVPTTALIVVQYWEEEGELLTASQYALRVRLDRQETGKEPMFTWQLRLLGDVVASKLSVPFRSTTDDLRLSNYGNAFDYIEYIRNRASNIVPPLVRLCEHESPIVRGAALLSLRQSAIDLHEYRRLLVKASDDPDQGVARGAKELLSRLPAP